MEDATSEWIAPGKEPDFYTCGKGDALSERPGTDKVVQVSCENENADGSYTKPKHEDHSEADQNEVSIVRADQKKLRGSMIEDIREMLELARKERRDDVVGWLLHGKAFKIHKRDLFIKDFLPRFSKVSKFSNFADALRNWGFVKLKKNRDKGAFYHKLFQRDRPELSLHVSRQQMKMAMTEWKSPDGTEPDLYQGISEDILLASEQMQALRGKKKRKLVRSSTKDARKKPRQIEVVKAIKDDKSEEGIMLQEV